MKYIKFDRYKFYKIVKNINFTRYNFSRIYKRINYRRYKYIPVYIAAIVVFSVFIYLSVPAYFVYDKSNIENVICKDINIKCSIQGKIKYSLLPSPRLEFKDFIIKDFVNKNEILGKVGNVAIKLSIYNLSNKNKLNFTKIELKNAEINFDLEKLKEYKNLFKKTFSSKPINLKKGEINFFEGKKRIANIKNVNFKYKSNKRIDEAILKGSFLGDRIHISLQNNNNDKNPSKNIIIKLLNLKLFTKVNIFNSESDKNTVSGNILFKKGKNRLSAIFDYKDNQIIVKHANLKNVFLNGKFNGEVKLIPYFSFNLNVDLNNVNFNKLYSFLINLDEKNKKNLFKINNKINGQLNLSADKIYSKYNLINSFESRIKFVNGNILFEQLLLSLGKLGAADITGIIKNDKKSTHFKFENNIFFDNLKRFYNKFGIYNKQNITSNLFISGNFDLVNLNMRLYEISNDKKFKDEDVSYLEKEFNNLVLSGGYASLFNFIKLKEFIRSITPVVN